MSTVQWSTKISLGIVAGADYKRNMESAAHSIRLLKNGSHSYRHTLRNSAADSPRGTRAAETEIENRMRNLLITTPAHARDNSAAMPKDRLDEKSSVDWDSMLDRIPPQYTAIARSVFCWLLASERPLLMREIIEIMAIENDQQISSDAVQERCSSLAQRILAATAGTVTVNRGQEVSFINNDIARHILKRSTGYSITLAEAHEHITLVSLRYLLYGNLTRDLSLESGSFRRSAMIYIVEHWITHYQASEEYSRSVSGYYDIFERQCHTENFNAWLKAYAEITSLPLSRIDTPMRLAITFRFVEFLKLRVEETCNLNPPSFAEISLDTRQSLTNRWAELVNFKLSSNSRLEQGKCRSARRRPPPAYTSTQATQRRRNRGRFLTQPHE